MSNLAKQVYWHAMNTLKSEGLTKEQVFHNDVQREYLLYVPPNYSKYAKAPVVLNFHGFGGTAAEQLSISDWRNLSIEHGFILIYPQGMELEKGETHWNPNTAQEGGKSSSNDLGYINKVVKKISNKFSIDPARIYATGYSNGAGMIYGLAHYKSDLITAIAPVSGLMNENSLSDEKGISPVGVISFNGTADWVRPVNGVQGYLASIEESTNYWARINSSPNDTITQYKKNSSNFVTEKSFSRDDGMLTIEQYMIEGGGHEWFDIDINRKSLDELAWQFFSRLRRIKGDITSFSPEDVTLRLSGSIKRRSADKITGIDSIVIDANSYGVDGLATFATAKNKTHLKRKFAKKDIDFLYDLSKGGLYFNENGSGKGLGDGGIIAIIEGAPALSIEHLAFL